MSEDIISSMKFGTFFPLNRLKNTEGLSPEFFRAIYALSPEEVEFQDLFLSRILDSICKHLLPSMLPESPEAATASFTYDEDINQFSLRKRSNTSSSIVVSIWLNTTKHGRQGEIFSNTAIVDCQFRDPARNKLAAKYLMLKSLFQPSRYAYKQTTFTFCLPMTLKRSHMATAEIISVTITLSPQDTIEDIITSFFIDQIPFDGFPES